MRLVGFGLVCGGVPGMLVCIRWRGHGLLGFLVALFSGPCFGSGFLCLKFCFVVLGFCGSNEVSRPVICLGGWALISDGGVGCVRCALSLLCLLRCYLPRCLSLCSTCLLASAVVSLEVQD